MGLIKIDRSALTDDQCRELYKRDFMTLVQGLRNWFDRNPALRDEVIQIHCYMWHSLDKGDRDKSLEIWSGVYAKMACHIYEVMDAKSWLASGDFEVFLDLYGLADFSEAIEDALCLKRSFA